ncbi:cytochrome P450 alkane hydroxylase [Cadophora sp. MPI-SDFR-AT-0126]|nr:cytochrome P450 alkane hydroxylase [Leotiomycetes sp. MPI-SDFR-AT-0126]
MELLDSRLWLLCCLVVPIFYHIYNKRKERQADKALGLQHGCLPPPRLENQRPFGVDRLEQIFRANKESRLKELFLFHSRQTGHTLEQVFLGAPAFGTVDPANIEAILSSNFKDGEAWKQSRELLRPQFHFKEYSDLNMFRDTTDNLLNAIAKEGVVDLQPLLFRLTLDMTTDFLFGESIRSLKVPESTGEQTFIEAFNIAQEYIAKRFHTCKKVHHFADTIINRNLSEDSLNGSGKYVFLRAMNKKTPDHTTACLLSWAFFLLVRHPNVLIKLRSEIAVYGNAELTRNDLRNMNYLQNILKETLRLYPSVPVNTRTTLRTTILPTGGGPDRKSPVLVPKGTTVAYSVYTMHRRPDLYGMDAELFRLERWDEDMPLNHDKTNAKWGYLPFNGGPRICLGMDFALVEAAYTIVRIVQRFPIIKLPKGEKVELAGVEKQKITLVMSITEGCIVELR